jgi:hypothetical protein
LNNDDYVTARLSPDPANARWFRPIDSPQHSQRHTRHNRISRRMLHGTALPFTRGVLSPSTDPVVACVKKPIQTERKRYTEPAFHAMQEEPRDRRSGRELPWASSMPGSATALRCATQRQRTATLSRRRTNPVAKTRSRRGRGMKKRMNPEMRKKRAARNAHTA